jgi:hypothetical protein
MCGLAIYVSLLAFTNHFDKLLMRDPWYLINYGSNTNEFRTYDADFLPMKTAFSETKKCG